MYPSSSKKGSAILIALIVLVLLIILSTVFIEKIYRFSQSSEGIENSNVAYYSALGMIEDTLYSGGVDKFSPWNVSNSSEGGTTSTGRRMVVSTGSTTVPIAGKGNSPFNTDYNIISIGEPVQLVIRSGIEWNNVNFNFRVPTIRVLMNDGTYTGAINTGVTLDYRSNSGYILWTLASSGTSLFASGETNIFKGNEISSSSFLISTKVGTTNSGTSIGFKSFYDTPGYLGINGAECGNYKCTLKLSLLRPVPLADGRSMNFLEYKIDFSTTSIPSQYMNLHAEGYAHGFLRSRDILFPQITTNTALDFAVLQ